MQAAEERRLQNCKLQSVRTIGPGSLRLRELLSVFARSEASEPTEVFSRSPSGGPRDRTEPSGPPSKPLYLCLNGVVCNASRNSAVSAHARGRPSPGAGGVRFRAVRTVVAGAAALDRRGRRPRARAESRHSDRADQPAHPGPRHRAGPQPLGADGLDDAQQQLDEQSAARHLRRQPGQGHRLALQHAVRRQPAAGKGRRQLLAELE